MSVKMLVMVLMFRLSSRIVVRVKFGEWCRVCVV